MAAIDSQLPSAVASSFRGFVAAISACAPPSRRRTSYVLDPVTPLAARRALDCGLPDILVAQAQVPDYLDRPQLVERTDANELKLVETDQWAERLSINISRVVAREPVGDGAGRRQCGGAGARSRCPTTTRSCSALNSFELDQNGAAVLSGRWSMTNADGTKELAAATVSLREPPL